MHRRSRPFWCLPQGSSWGSGVLGRVSWGGRVPCLGAQTLLEVANGDEALPGIAGPRPAGVFKKGR